MDRKNLLSDLVAGFTTGLFSIPEGMAYAKLPRKEEARRAVVVLTLRYMETLPSSTLKWLVRYNRELKDSGNLLLLAGVGHHILDLLDHTGIIDAIRRENTFPAQPVMTASMEAAMERASAWLQAPLADRIGY